MPSLEQIRPKLLNGVKFRTNASGMGVLKDFYESEVLCDKHAILYVKPPDGRRGFRCPHLEGQGKEAWAINDENTEAEIELA